MECLTSDGALWRALDVGGCIGHAPVLAGVPASSLLDGDLTVRPAQHRPLFRGDCSTSAANLARRGQGSSSTMEACAWWRTKSVPSLRNIETLSGVKGCSQIRPGA